MSTIFPSSFFCLVTFSCLLQYSTQAENCGFSQWVDPPAIHPYQQYIDYLEDVVIYNLKRELSEALASPDPSSSAGEDWCWKCLTCTCECHEKDWSPCLHHLHPHVVHVHPHGVHVVATLRRLYALWAVLVQLNSLGMLQ
jgi:hypothetical protein